MTENDSNIRCERCGQNPFKLIPNCKQHEKSRKRFVKLCIDQQSFKDIHALVWTLENLAEHLIAFGHYETKVITAVLEKIDKKVIDKSLKRKNSIIRDAIKLSLVHNRFAVHTIEAREELSRIAHDMCSNQLDMRIETLRRKPKAKSPRGSSRGSSKSSSRGKKKAKKK